MAFLSLHPAAKSNTSTSQPKITATQFTQSIPREAHLVTPEDRSARGERRFTIDKGRTRGASLVKKLRELKVLWSWPQDNDILCNGLDDSSSPTLRRKHLDLGSQFDYITIARQFHSGCKTAPKSFDRK